MKRLIIILLMLCLWVFYPMMHAQLYRSSSSTYHSYSTGGVLQVPTTSFRSTSAYMEHSVAKTNNSSIAPMRVANGAINTVASTIQLGILADDQAYAPGAGIQGRKNTMAPPTETDPYVPLGDGWDVALLLLLSCAIYAIYISRRQRAKI